MGTGIFVAAPPRVAPTTGLFSVANVIEESDPHAAQGINYESEPRGTASIAEDPCGLDPDATKLFDQPTYVYSDDAFPIYKGVACTPLDWESHAPRAEKALDYGTETAVETKLYAEILPAIATDETPTASTAVSPLEGLSILEQDIGLAHAGHTITIHAPRAIVNALVDLGVVTANLDGSLRTINGSLVASGLGYVGATGPGAVVAAAGESWMYATGAVSIFLGPITAGQAFAPVTNDHLALAERWVTPAIDAPVGAVLVSPGA